jgi:hypothetical protein
VKKPRRIVPLFVLLALLSSFILEAGDVFHDTRYFSLFNHKTFLSIAGNWLVRLALPVEQMRVFLTKHFQRANLEMFCEKTRRF